MLRALAETYHAVVVNLRTGESHIVLAADPKKFLFNYCRWANATRIICSMRFYGRIRSGLPDRRYRDGRTTFTRMVAVDIDGGNRLSLVPEVFDQRGSSLRWNAVDQDEVISWLPGDPEHVLIQLARDDREYPSVYRLNIYTNKLRRVKKYRESIFWWFADREGVLRLASGFRGVQPIAYLVGGSGKPLDTSGWEGIAIPGFLGIGPQGKTAYMASYLDGRHYNYYTVDLTTGEVTGTLHADGEFDLFGGGLHQDAETGEPLLVQYYAEQPVQRWFDAARRATFEAVREALAPHHSNVTVEHLNRAGMVLLAQGKGSVPTYYVYTDSDRSLKRIAATYSDLATVYKTETVTYHSRDGYRITAYLATPEGEGPHPTIIFPHGGPNSRSYPDFDYWVQFFVSRGYAVLKPNFRGSVGYGAAHLEAGFEQWGLRMQDDVVDGLDWMIAQKITDPGRVCFVGGSYGGYVALVAAFKMPERLRCAVSFAGVSDLLDLKDHIRNFRLGELTLDRIQEGRAVTENSPFHQVERIGVPVLLVHGDADRSVMIEQSRRLAGALERAGKDHLYIEQAHGDHYLSIQSHRLEFFEAMDRFLAAHLRQDGSQSSRGLGRGAHAPSLVTPPLEIPLGDPIDAVSAARR